MFDVRSLKFDVIHVFKDVEKSSSLMKRKHSILGSVRPEEASMEWTNGDTGSSAVLYSLRVSGFGDTIPRSVVFINGCALGERNPHRISFLVKFAIRHKCPPDTYVTGPFRHRTVSS